VRERRTGEMRGHCIDILVTVITKEEREKQSDRIGWREITEIRRKFTNEMATRDREAD